MADPLVEHYVDPSKQTRTSCTATASTTTATITQTNHGYSTNDWVKIQGANEADYNGNFQITSTGADTYTYTMAGSPSSPATGTLLASKLNLTGDDGTTEAKAWADLQYAIDELEASGWSTHGNWIHIKAGTPEVLAVPITATEWGVNNPLRFQGYGDIAKDGTQAVIDCSGGRLMTTTGDAKQWVDLEIKNGPSADWLAQVGRYNSFIQCYFHDIDGGLEIDSLGNCIMFCRFEDFGTASYDGIFVNNQWTQIIGNWFKQDAARSLRYAIYIAAANTHTHHNIISMDGGTTAIRVQGAQYSNVMGNTCYSEDVGVGTGIYMSAIGSSRSAFIGNNYIEGFSVGIQRDGSSGSSHIEGANAFYNNTSATAGANESFIDVGGNETLSNSGINKTTGGFSNIYADRFGFYKPVNEGSMLTGGYPEAL